MKRVYHVFICAVLLLAGNTICFSDTNDSATLALPGADKQSFGETPHSLPSSQSDPADQAHPATRLDELFDQLKHAHLEKDANEIARSIQNLWESSPSPTIDLLMVRAQESLFNGENNAALDFIDQAIMLDPTYPEAWHRRATINYNDGNFAKAMSDIARTLELEPRHFVALASMASILRASGHEEHALETYRKILEVFPMMRPAQSAVILLQNKNAAFPAKFIAPPAN